MKGYKYILFCLPALLYMACDSNSIEDYELGAKLNFYSYRTVNNVPEKLCSYSDEDYVKGVTEKLDSVRVDIMGVAQDENRTFYCKVDFKADEPHMQILLEEQYVMPSERYSTFIKFKILPPPAFEIRHLTNISFDYSRITEDFTPGLTELQTCIVRCTYRIRPDVWHNSVWGDYSNGKYKFMMDKFKDVYGNIKRTAANLTYIKKQYEEYRKNNPPILDDQYPPQEIKF